MEVSKKFYIKVLKQILYRSSMVLKKKFYMEALKKIFIWKFQSFKKLSFRSIHA